MKETYRSWYAILLRWLADHIDTTSAIIVTEHNGRLVRRWSPTISHEVNNLIFDALYECLPTQIWSLANTRCCTQRRWPSHHQAPTS